MYEALDFRNVIEAHPAFDCIYHARQRQLFRTDSCNLQVVKFLLAEQLFTESIKMK